MKAVAVVIALALVLSAALAGCTSLKPTGTDSDPIYAYCVNPN